MKHFLLISIIYLLSVYSVTNAQWVQVDQEQIYAMTFWVSDTSLIAGCGNGIYNSNNNGTTWNLLLPWTNLEFVNAIVSAPAETGGTNIFAGGLGGVYLSTNGGTNWIAANVGLENKEVRSLAVSTDETKAITTLFAGTTSGVFRSTDNGTSWSESGLDSCDVLALTVIKDETGKSIILAGIEETGFVSGSIFRSIDNGSSWIATSLSTYFTACFAPFPDGEGGTKILAGTYSGVYESTDYGINWTFLDKGPHWSVHSLVIIPNEAGGMNFLAGTFKGGISLSIKNGEEWNEANTGLMYEDVSVCALAVSGNNIFAATNDINGRIWRRSLSEILASITSVNNSGVVPSHFRLDQNYPNPFNPSTSIQYAIGSRQFVQLKVYDVLGKEAATLVDEYKVAGGYEVNFDASMLSSGIYFYKLKAGNFIETKKMIVIK